MVLDLVVTNLYDGYSAEIPSIKGCEAWSKNEEEAINKSVELLRFYLSLDVSKKINLDKSRTEKDQIIYKLIFTK